jgi:TRAP-type mannitol/chloroaromatic compound transport system permease small subunit
MPSLNFVMPHWLYWGTLIIFPILAWYLFAQQQRRGIPSGPSLFVAYLFWLCAGFIGLHRFYLRSAWGIVFIPVFLGILNVNGQIRDAREDVSRTRAALEEVRHDLTQARPIPGITAPADQAERLKNLESDEVAAKSDYEAMQGELERRNSMSRWLALLLAAMLIVDAALLPGLLRRARAYEAAHPAAAVIEPPIDVVEIGTHEDPTLGFHTAITDRIEWLNTRIGEFVAYWAVISVFAYYYEVIARFVFNSPTNWVHESMFLMYGMQYMLAGAFAYCEDQHVRVDVFYAQFSPRGKALADIVTSVFFFIFILTMLWTGAKFALDAIGNSEVSFTEWGVQYWPVKLMIPIGAALLALQGLSKLIKDIVFIAQGERLSHGA